MRSRVTAGARRYNRQHLVAVDVAASLAQVAGITRLPADPQTPPSGLRRVNVVLKEHETAIANCSRRTAPASNQSGQGSLGAQWRLPDEPIDSAGVARILLHDGGLLLILSWTPRLLNAAGLSASQGMTGGVLLSLGGIAGCGLFRLCRDTRRHAPLATRCTHRQCCDDCCVRTRHEPAGHRTLDGAAARHHRERGDGGSLCHRATTLSDCGAHHRHGVLRRSASAALAQYLRRLRAARCLIAAGCRRSFYFFFSAPFIVAAFAIFLIGPARARATAGTQ